MRRLIVLCALLAGCGGAGVSGPPPLLLVPRSHATVARAAARRTQARVMPVRAPEARPSGAAEARRALERARTAYRDLDFDASLIAADEAVDVLTRHLGHAEDFDALHSALLYRALADIGLGRSSDADTSLLAAARLRPERGLPEDRYAPDVRARYDAFRERVRNEVPVSVYVESVPSGGRVRVDGNDAGRTPFTIEARPGAHTVEVERLGRVGNASAFDAARERLEIVLRSQPASLDVLAAQLADGAARSDARELSVAERDTLVRLVGSRLLLALDAARGVVHVLALPERATAASWDEPVDTASDAALHASLAALLERASRPDFGPGARPR